MRRFKVSYLDKNGNKHCAVVTAMSIVKARHIAYNNYDATMIIDVEEL